jgi:hypothetical protein
MKNILTATTLCICIFPMHAAEKQPKRSSYLSEEFGKAGSLYCPLAQQDGHMHNAKAK